MVSRCFPNLLCNLGEVAHACSREGVVGSFLKVGIVPSAFNSSLQNGGVSIAMWGTLYTRLS